MLQHQIVQSPARLGLTSPNSPSIQNPTPPKFPITTTSSSSSHQQQQPPQQHHAPPTTALKGFIPPNITVPSGWKPGMPVDLPAPPPGWKPGDAVPLESLPRAVDQRMLPLARPGLHKPPETIQVDYACTPEEVQQHFQSCGTVKRVTILTDKFGQPKGFAYVEFVEVDAVQEALALNESELHGRQLKVLPKRTNVPGMSSIVPDTSILTWVVGSGGLMCPLISILRMDTGRFLDSEDQCDTCPITRR